MTKPFKGEIYNWTHHILKDGGMFISGTPHGHPTFQGWIRTSLVVKIDYDTGKLETLNSTYQLVGEEVK